MSEQGPVLGISSVTFGYPHCPVFLGPVDLALAAPAMLGVVGPNGAGKSTLLRLIVGLLRPNSGRITMLGRNVRGPGTRPRAGDISFLPQTPPAPPDMRALEIVLWGRYPRRRYRFFDSAEDVGAAEQAMLATGCLDFAERTLDTLSAGERQRVHLAAALSQEPRAIALDEPTANLDPYHALRIFEMLTGLCREKAIAVLVVTHDLNLAGQFCDELVLLSSGQVVGYGPADQVLQSEGLERAYGVAFQRIVAGDESRPFVVPLRAQQAATP